MKNIVGHTENGIESAVWPVPRGRAGWRERLPLLQGNRVVLRELTSTDAPVLATLLAAEEVSRFLSAPPETADAFDRCIQCAREQRAAGTAVWYAVIIKGFDEPVGMFQVRAIEPGFATGEWGFVLSSSFWGTGIFEESAALILEFAFGVLGVRRLEARVAVRNGRGIGALRKLGAVQEGLLRKGLLQNGHYLDQALYTIADDDWRTSPDGSSVGYVHGPVH